MAARALFLVAAVTTVAAAVLGVAHGASYTVGAPAGSWDLQTNYTRWASTITFRAGDQLVFKYSRGAHNVVEVSKAGYDSCSASTPLASFATGEDTVTLPTGGATRYFICGVPGHCAAGMKLAVRVEAAAAATTSPSPSPAPVAAVAPRAAARPPTASSAPPSPAPAAAMAPREAAQPPTSPTTPAGARAPAAVGGVQAVPPSSSAAASSGVSVSLAGLVGFAAAVAALMALH